MKLYPIFANIEKKLAVIVGGGEVGFRKLNDLLDSGAKIKIIAPEILDGIKQLKKNNPDAIEILQREYKHGDLEGAYIVFTATGKKDVNKLIYDEAKKSHTLMNSADDPDNCSFFVPSMTRRGDLTIAVSTGGNSPAMAARLRRTLEKNLPDNIEDILNALREAREILKNMENLTQVQRGDILNRIVNDDKLLDELLLHKGNNTLPSFFNCILKSIK